MKARSLLLALIVVAGGLVCGPAPVWAGLPLIVTCNLTAGQPGGRILRYDGGTGDFTDVFDPNVATPRDVDLGPNGDLYVSSPNSYAINQYDVVTGALKGQISGVEPEGIEFGPDGNLYVLQSYDIRRYDGATGAFIDTFAAWDNPNFAWDLTFGPDGNLYVSSPGADGVMRFDGQTGTFMDVFVSSFDTPDSLLFGPDGNLYVAGTDDGSQRVFHFDGQTGQSLGAFTSGGGLDEPNDMTFGPDNNLYVCGGFNDAVLRFNGQTGVFIDIFADGGAMDAPQGLAFVPEPATLGMLALGGLALLRRRTLLIRRGGK